MTNKTKIQVTNQYRIILFLRNGLCLHSQWMDSEYVKEITTKIEEVGKKGFINFPIIPLEDGSILDSCSIRCKSICGYRVDYRQ